MTEARRSGRARRPAIALVVAALAAAAIVVLTLATGPGDTSTALTAEGKDRSDDEGSAEIETAEGQQAAADEEGVMVVADDGPGDGTTGSGDGASPTDDASAAHEGDEHGTEPHDTPVPASIAEVPDEPVSPLADALAGDGQTGEDTTAEPPESEDPSSGNTDPTSTTKPSASGGFWQPAPGTSWQWQLTGPVDTSIDVEVYDIDLFDTARQTIDQLKTDGRTVICYFSAGAWEDWRSDADALDPSLRGASNGWPGEQWIDISKLAAVRPFIEARLDLAVAKGCDAVEPDNVDGYQNDSGFELTASDQIVFNSFVAEAAHARGLSVGLKNAAELVGVLEPLFDWALVEECARYDECETYAPFVAAGKAVFHVEYGGDHGYCAETSALGFSSLEKDDDVGPVHRPCP